MSLQLQQATVPSGHPAIARQYAWRFESPARVGIKVNLYRECEVEGLALALERPDLATCPVECLMVGDSYFMTHLGRRTTKLGPDERAEALDTMVDLVAEVRAAMDATLPRNRMPYLIGDMPDGSADDTLTMLRTADRFLSAGGDVVKVELGTRGTLASVEAAARRGIATIVHLGYTPQSGRLTRYGETVGEAETMFAAARAARDAGACAIVLEMVSEAVGQALSVPAPSSLPVYSIFSGKAAFGGQSLNAWDSVFLPAGPRRYFPCTAFLDPDADRSAYTPGLVGDCLAQLIRLTLAGRFPLSPPTALTEADLEVLAHAAPWGPAH